MDILDDIGVTKLSEKVFLKVNYFFFFSLLADFSLHIAALKCHNHYLTAFKSNPTKCI